MTKLKSIPPNLVMMDWAVKIGEPSPAHLVMEIKEAPPPIAYTEILNLKRKKDSRKQIKEKENHVK